MLPEEKGRSMIEMLGVLSIIAVLTVIGFYGFSQALAKYRVDKTLAQIQQTVVRLQTAFVAQSNYSSLGDSLEEVNNVLANANIVTKDMFVRDNDGNIKVPYAYKNIFKGSIQVRVGNKFTDNDRGSFIIHYDSVPRLSCIEIASYAWGKSSDSGYIATAVNLEIPPELNYNNCQTTPANREGSALHCFKNQVMLKEAAVRACREEKNNTLEFMFY